MDKPLHVQVAEALGWTGVSMMHGGAWGGFRPVPDGEAPDPRIVPRYDTDWSATGPLIERYKLDVWWESLPGDGEWTATPNMRAGGDEMDTGHGPTPLLAVCELILALKAEGKLDPTLAARAS